MLTEIHAALDAEAKTNAIVRIRHSMRALGRALKLKVDLTAGEPGEDITARGSWPRSSSSPCPCGVW